MQGESWKPGNKEKIPAGCRISFGSVVGHQGQLVPCFKETNHIVEASTTYTAKGPTGKKKRHFTVSSAFCCLLGPATRTIFRVLKSGSCLEAKQMVQDWLIGFCHDKVCCTDPRGLFLTAPQPSSHMDTHAQSYVFPFRGPWNTREIFHLPHEWVTGETEFCPWDRGESMVTGNFCTGHRAFGTLSQLIVKLDNPCMVNQKLAVSTFRGPAASLLVVVTEALYTSCATYT